MALKDKVTQLKAKAKAEEVVAESWLVTNRVTLIVAAVCLLVGFVLGKL